jgi:hypothetical protein
VFAKRWKGGEHSGDNFGETGSEHLILTIPAIRLDSCATGAGLRDQRMARKLRVQYPGAMYHAMNRGDRRKPIFTDDDDPQLYLRPSEMTLDWNSDQFYAWVRLAT